MKELNKLRNEIDKIDKKIATLISKRQNLSKSILKAKSGSFTYDPEREKRLIKKIFTYKIDKKLAERVWRQIIGYNLSKQKKLKIGYLVCDEISFAAYNSCFGHYFKSIKFINEKHIINALDKKKIDIAFLEKSKNILKHKGKNYKKVGEFPLFGNFYKKKYFILK